MSHRLRNHSMLGEGTNYKVHTLFIAACLCIGNKLQSPCVTCIARGQCCSGKFQKDWWLIDFEITLCLWREREQSTKSKVHSAC
jgi:hypothetical protein